MCASPPPPEQPITRLVLLMVDDRLASLLDDQPAGLVEVEAWIERIN